MCNALGVTLTTTNHRRDAAGLTYVYPVISRRAAGVSIGVNLNPNNACNWRCIYCQVPGLVRGSGPTIDIARLQDELHGLLADVLEGDFLERQVPEPAHRVLRDVALSGNGEPTTSPQLGDALRVVQECLRQHGAPGEVPVTLISNGSMMHRPSVQDCLRALGEMGGRVWFKLDRATDAGLATTNGASTSAEKHLERLRIAARLCETWIQTCWFAVDGVGPRQAERRAYLDALAKLVEDDVPIKGVLLYGLARPSQQVEAPRLSALDGQALSALAAAIEALGLPVQVAV